MQRSALALILDLLAALCVIATVAIDLTGGFVVHLGPARVSMRSIDRAALAVVLTIVLRVIVDRRTPAFGRLRVFGRRVRDLIFRCGDPAVPPPIPGQARRALVAAGGICAAAMVLLAPQIRQLYSVPDLGDPLFSIWRMAWVPHQLAHDPRHLFDANIFYPDPLALTYSDSMIVPALTAAPLLIAGVHPVVAYNLLFLSGFIFSGVATYLLVERLTGSPRAAFIAAMMYGFYPYRFEHYSHLELQMTHWMPLALLALHLFVDTGRWPFALGAALAMAAQLYSSLYYAIFFAVYASAVAVVLLSTARVRIPRLIVPATAAAAVLVLVALPLTMAYVASTPIKGERNVAVVEFYSAELSDYMRPHERSWLYGGRLVRGRHEERALFPGVTPIAFAAAALVPPLGTIEAAYFAGLLVAFDGSRGFNGLLYPRLYAWLSPVRSMRVPARFSIVAALSLAVLAGFGVRRLLGRFERRSTQNVLLAGLIAAVMLDFWPVLRLRPVWRDPPQVYNAIREAPRVVLAEFPIHDNPLEFEENTRFMYFSLWHWRPMVNGYSGYTPPSYRDFVYSVIGFPAAPTLEALRQRGVTHVTINCGFFRGAGCEDVMHQMDDSAGLRRVAEAKWYGKTVRLYELVR